MTPQARFTVGQVVHHLKFDYRGVIVDVDAEYSGSEAWYQQVAVSRPPKDKPWYRILVDGADHMTYVAERHLEADESCQPIGRPDVDDFFKSFENCAYRPQRRNN
jgi:heat shock protein HspQ